MNKTEAIKKINTMGKVGSIICLIGKILLIIATVFTLIGTIVFYALPKDFVTVKVNSTSSTFVNLEKFTKGMNASQLDEMKKSIEAAGTGSVTVNNNTYVGTDLSLDGDVLTVNSDVVSNIISTPNIRFILIFAILLMICAFICVVFTGKLCKSFETCESPFEDAIVNNLRNLAFSLIPVTVMSIIADSVITAMTTVGNSYSFSVNFTTVFVILIILALSFIFKYGAMLQKESDETL